MPIKGPKEIIEAYMTLIDIYQEIIKFILESLSCSYVAKSETCNIVGRQRADRCRNCTLVDHILQKMEEINGSKYSSS